MLLPIPSKVLAQLKCAPELVSVRYSTTSSGHDNYAQKSSVWDTHDLQGYLVRTYTSESSTLTLVRLRLANEGRWESKWQEYGDLDGAGVHWVKIERALGLAGEAVQWDAAGRGLELPEPAWLLLKD
jgi:hypothetical protein